MAEDAQLASLRQVRAEIEGIASAAGRAEPDGPRDAAVSYSFGLFSGPEETFSELVRTVQSLLTKLKPVATLRTTVDGLSATTVINYGGRATSVWSNPVSYALAETHLCSLERTIELRMAAAGAVGAAASAMAAISILAANPLTVLHALRSAEALKQALERLLDAAEAA